MPQKRKGDTVRRRILSAGLEMWPDIQVRKLATKLDMEHTGVLHYYNNLTVLKEAIAKHAVDVGDSRVICLLLASKHPLVADMPEEERKKHAQILYHQ